MRIKLPDERLALLQPQLQRNTLGNRDGASSARPIKKIKKTPAVDITNSTRDGGQKNKRCVQTSTIEII